MQRAACIAALAALLACTRAQTLPLLLPDPNAATRLVLQPEALKWLRSLRGPIALVAAIGPYRSGKSFLLNQLSNQPCDSGFLVGHRRDTQTKGVWLGTRPRVIERRRGGNLTVVYLDTEGFDATGKAAAYDDRIFAFAVLFSSVLVYNLIETVKEADIGKLSFAAQLSHEFLRRGALGGGEEPSARGGSRARGEWVPPALLWLVQRDFLEGSTVEEYLKKALRPVPIPEGASDPHAEHLNAIRSQLRSFGVMSGMGLPQPHLKRTSLCEIAQQELSVEYREGMVQVREWAETQLLRRVSERWASELVEQISQLATALNEREIPSAGSVIDAFNREAYSRALKRLRQGLERLPLPLDRAPFASAAAVLLNRSRAELLRLLFGDDKSSISSFEDSASFEISSIDNKNFRASHARCTAIWDGCTVSLDQLQRTVLPSRRRHYARLAMCNASMHQCVGPAAAPYHERLASLGDSGTTTEQFFSRVSHLFTLLCIGGILFFRYVCKVELAELGCWAAMVVVEVIPRLAAMTQLTPDAPSFWETPMGARVIEVYETAVYNEYVDMDDWVYALPSAAVLIWLLRRCWHRLMLCLPCLATRCPCCAGRCCCASPTPPARRRRAAARQSYDEMLATDAEDDDWDEGGALVRPPQRGGKAKKGGS